MDNIDYYMKCLNAPSLFAALKILLNSLWENGEDKESDSNSIVQQVEQIHKYIERSYHENITLTALAEEYHMDASYLSRIFSQKYGETIIAFLTRIRMEWDMTIIIISAEYSAKRWEAARGSTEIILSNDK